MSLAKDNDRLSDMAQAALGAVDKFSSQHIVDQWLELFEKCA